MKLFVSEGNPHCLKAVAALEVTGVKCDVQYVSHEGKTSMAQSLEGQSTCTCHFRLTCNRWTSVVFPVVLEAGAFRHLCLLKRALTLKLAASQACACAPSLMNGVGGRTPEAARKLQCAFMTALLLASYECSYPQPLSLC